MLFISIALQSRFYHIFSLNTLDKSKFEHDSDMFTYGIYILHSLSTNDVHYSQFLLEKGKKKLFNISWWWY